MTTRFTILFAGAFLVAAAMAVAGCQQAPPPPTLTPTIEPTVTAFPTSTPKPSPTATPTATPGPTRTPTRVPAPTAATRTGAPAAKAPAASGTAIAEMEKAMAQAIPTILAALPTAQPTPAGEVTTLSQDDLAGTWDGWITIEVVSLKGASPQDQKTCDEQLGFIKGRPIPSSMQFEPQSASTGTVRIRSEEGDEPQDEVLPYTYRNGVISIAIEQNTSRGSFEGKTVRTESGYAMTGTWKSDAAASPDEMIAADAVTITGNWVMEKPRR